jgi:hypothetical protein
MTDREIIKEARDLIVMCSLLDKSGQCNEMADKMDKQLSIPVVKNWVAVKERLPDNCDQVFVKFENDKYGINEWWESDDCWKYQFDNMMAISTFCRPYGRAEPR